MMQITQQKEVEQQKKKANEKLNKQRWKNAEMLRKEEAVISADITAAEKEQCNILSSSGSLLQEAEAKLNEAIEVGDLDKIAIAHGLLEISRKRLIQETTDLFNLAEKRKACVAKMKRHHDQSNTVDSRCSSSAARKASTSYQF